MKILADANPIYSGQLTGIGYFTDELLKHLSKVVDLQGFAFNFKGSKNITTTYEVEEQRRLPGKVLSYPRYFGIDVPLDNFFKVDDVDVVLGTNYLLPPTGKVPNIVSVHDLCFMDHPEWVQGRNARILRTMLGKTLKRSSGLITISDFSAGRIRNIYNYKKPILVVSIPPKKSLAGLRKPKPFNDIVMADYFLFVSTIEPRKNVTTMINAYESLPNDIQNKHPLVLAGKPGWDPEALKRLRSGVNKNIHYLNYVVEAERNWLYSNALVTIIPSHYEGFGMMTLESLDQNTPTVTSDIPPQREILAELGQYFKPTDTSKLSNLMLRFSDKNFREQQLKIQRTVLANYSWDTTANQVVEFAEKILKRID